MISTELRVLVCSGFYLLVWSCKSPPPPSPPPPPPPPIYPPIFTSGIKDFPCFLEDSLSCEHVLMNHHALINSDMLEMVDGNDRALFRRNYTWSIHGTFFAHFTVIPFEQMMIKN
jgi:hypothetical protein